MMVDLLFVTSQGVLSEQNLVRYDHQEDTTHLVSVNEDLNEGDQEVENEPVVHHFDGAGLGEALTHPHKHRGQHQHHLVQVSSV